MSSQDGTKAAGFSPFRGGAGGEAHRGGAQRGEWSPARAPEPVARVAYGATEWWRGVPGCVAYRVEIWQAEDGEGGAPRPGRDRPFRMGIDLAAETTSVDLERLGFGRLETGRTYSWRVVAIGPRGTVIGRSRALTFTFGR